MHKPLRESVRLAEAARTDASSGRMRIQVLSPGWGSSGYYSPEVCESAAGLVRAGTKMFIDHPTATDQADRPERSIRDIGAVITEDGAWDPALKAVVAECKPIAPYKEVLTDLAEHVGLSIRGSATDIYEGEAEGRRGPIIESLADISSVDFVTRAGRGGRVLSVLESARTALAEAVSDTKWSEFSQSDYDDAQWKRACLMKVGDDDTKASWKLPVREPEGALSRGGCHAAASVLGGGRGGVQGDADAKKAAARKLVGLYRNQLDEDPPESLLTAAGMSSEEADRRIAEATSDERREQLNNAVQTEYGGRDRWAWVRDFDESAVWFHASNQEEESRTWQQSFTVADDDMSVSLTGERTEVRPVTKYVPVTTDPAGQSTTTEESEEDTMGKIQVEEAEHRRLTETAGRVETLESERDALKTENTQLKESAAERDRADRARTLIGERAHEAEIEFTPLEERGLLTDLPTTDKGALDEEKFTKAVDEEAAKVAEAKGAGRVRGFGSSVEPSGNGEVSEADFDKEFAIERKGA